MCLTIVNFCAYFGHVSSETNWLNVVTYISEAHGHRSTAPCRLQGCKNRPAPFPGRTLYKVTKPSYVCPVS